MKVGIPSDRGVSRVTARTFATIRRGVKRNGRVGLRSRIETGCRASNPLAACAEPNLHPPCNAGRTMDNPQCSKKRRVARPRNRWGRGVKKHNGSRKPRNRPKKKAQAAGRRAPSPAQISQAPQVPIAPVSAHAAASMPRGIDWLALAIALLPLVAMALLEMGMRDVQAPPSTRHSMVEAPVAVPSPAPIAPWHGDLALEAMPVVPDAAGRMALATAEPPPAPWHGDLAIEDMPVVPDAAGRTTHASAEPPPTPWHGDLALEAMPVVPDAAGRTTAMPASSRADVAAMPAPICLPANAGVLGVAEHGHPDIPPRHPIAFGRALAAAAHTQIDDFIIYNARYVSIAYPLGDTASLYGVCTDVVVRAYRAFGIDFQELIHTSRLGRGDPSIDHRRVEVLQRFLERHGTSFEISEFPEDYLPGDIVTYHRPQGRISQHHIAVVSDRIAPSGRPMIVHNRGWGPQIEDALFADRITGHYRFTPVEAEAFARTRLPRAVGRRQSSTVSLAAGR